MSTHTHTHTHVFLEDGLTFMYMYANGGWGCKRG